MLASPLPPSILDAYSICCLLGLEPCALSSIFLFLLYIDPLPSRQSEMHLCK